jgi:hypothetical protein
MFRLRWPTLATTAGAALLCGCCGSSSFSFLSWSNTRQPCSRQGSCEAGYDLGASAGCCAGGCEAGCCGMPGVGDTGPVLDVPPVPAYPPQVPPGLAPQATVPDLNAPPRLVPQPQQAQPNPYVPQSRTTGRGQSGWWD